MSLRRRIERLETGSDGRGATLWLLSVLGISPEQGHEAFALRCCRTSAVLPAHDVLLRLQQEPSLVAVLLGGEGGAVPLKSPYPVAAFRGGDAPAGLEEVAAGRS